MVYQALAGWNLEELDFVFIDNAGNLVCPSSYDLGENMRLVLLSVTEGEDKPLKFATIFNSSDVAAKAWGRGLLLSKPPAVVYATSRHFPGFKKGTTPQMRACRVRFCLQFLSTGVASASGSRQGRDAGRDHRLAYNMPGETI